MDQNASAATLIVNMDQDLRRTQAAMLKNMGFTKILQAADGNEAWSMIKTFQVAMVICSWRLSRDMSGLVLLKVIRADQAYAEIPFLMVVDEITRAQVLEAGQAGVSDIIVLPFDVDTFKKKVEQSLKGEDAETIESKVLISQGSKLMQEGRYQEALDSFQKVLTVHESAEVYFNLGYIRTSQGRYEEAINAFRKATQINNAFAQAFQKMGEVYALMGRSDEARKCLEKAAEIFMEKNMDVKAEEAFQKVLEINPNTPNVFNSLGIVYRRQGKLSDAARMYRKALKVNPFDEHIHYNLARVYTASKQYEDAVVILEKAIHINPDFAEAENLLKSILNNLQ